MWIGLLRVNHAIERDEFVRTNLSLPAAENRLKFASSG